MAESSNNTEFLTEFIDIYRQLPCLWKVKSKSYSNRHEKNKAYEKLLLFYKQTNPNATIDSVKKKINNLRSAFRKELKKVRKSKRSGEGSDNIYVPTLWYFHLLMFTADQEEPRASVSNDTQSDEETEIECEFQNDPDETESDKNATSMEENSNFSLPDVPETPIVIDRPYRTPSRSSASQPPSRTASRSSTTTPNNRPGVKRSRENMIQKACESLYSENQDEFDAVGNNVACKLRRMNDNQKILAEHLINKIILFGIQNKLNDHSDVVLSTNDGAMLKYPLSNPNQANIYTTKEKNKNHSAGPFNDTGTMYTIMESRQAYQQELSKSNNGVQSSVNYSVCNPNETNIFTTTENILSGNETIFNDHPAGPSSDTTFNIHAEHNSQQTYRQELTEFVTFQK